MGKDRKSRASAARLRSRGKASADGYGCNDLARHRHATDIRPPVNIALPTSLAHGGVEKEPMMQPDTIYSKPRSVRIAHPPHYTLFGVDVAIHLTRKQTGGRFSLSEALFPPGSDVGLHLHRQEDESLHVLEGTIALQIGTEHADLTAGQSCFIPSKTPHRIRNLTSDPARVMAVHTSGDFDRFVAEMGTPAEMPVHPITQNAMAQLADDLGRYGLEMIEPPEALR
jgi:mannose-6-phosphate isomerase-like protein (cupin superfamily)